MWLLRLYTLSSCVCVVIPWTFTLVVVIRLAVFAMHIATVTVLGRNMFEQYSCFLKEIVLIGWIYRKVFNVHSTLILESEFNFVVVLFWLHIFINAIINVARDCEKLVIYMHFASTLVCVILHINHSTQIGIQSFRKFDRFRKIQWYFSGYFRLALIVRYSILEFDPKWL